jgi:hypothetical protein
MQDINCERMLCKSDDLTRVILVSGSPAFDRY